LKLYFYALRRIGIAVLVLLGITVLTFYLIRGLPGINPIVSYVTPTTPLNQYPIIAKEQGFDNPLYIQYFIYMKDLLTGNWGYSRSVDLPVTQAIESFFPATLELTLAALVVALIGGFGLGLTSALRNRKPADYVSRVISIESVSLPPFWIGIIFSLAAFYIGQSGLPTLPLDGRVTQLVLIEHPLTHITGLYLLDSLLTANWPVFENAFLHLILPALTLSLFPMGVISRTVRASVLDVLSQDHVIFALSKGLSRRRLIWSHVVKNSLIAVLTILGLVVATLLGGSVLVESVFAWPGMGQWAANSITSNDTAGIMGFTIVTAAFFVFINLAVDIAYVFIDPRIRY
jgi:ABC-type dipeptide/oligopeptide/nickel transport system permease component